MASADDDDRLGMGNSDSRVAAALGKRVPQRVVRRSIAVSLDTDRERYEVGEPVEMTIEFANRLPLPVSVETPRRRLWGWSVDGELDASDERRHVSDTAGVVSFRGGEHKTITHRWNGLFKRTGDPTHWVEPSPGEYELAAFIALDGEARPEDRTTIRIG